MCIRAIVVALFMIFAFATAAMAEPKLAGAWDFSQQKGSFGGTIQLNQQGPTVNGIWHSDKGRVERDSTVYGEVKGKTVTLVREFAKNRQTYVMTLSDDGNHMSGFGEGTAITHADLDMVKAGSGQALTTPAGPPSAAGQQGSSAPGAPITMGQIGGLLVILLFPLLMVAFALFNEYIFSTMSGWKILAAKYPGSAYYGDTKVCWYMKAIREGGLRKIVTFGQLKPLTLRMEIPPIYIGVSSQGLYLKRNIWNFLHQPILIPWDKVAMAKEITHADMNSLTRFGTSATPTANDPWKKGALGTVSNLLGGNLLEIQLSDPPMSLITQEDLTRNSQQFLAGRYMSRS